MSKSATDKSDKSTLTRRFLRYRRNPASNQSSAFPKNLAVLLLTGCLTACGAFEGERADRAFLKSSAEIKEKQLETGETKVSVTAVAGGKKTGEKLANGLDFGDYYNTPGGVRKLWRLAGAVAIHTGAEAQSDAFIQQMTKPGAILEGYEAKKETAGWVVFSAPVHERQSQLQDKQKHHEKLTDLRARLRHVVNPVFVDPESGLSLLATEEIVIRVQTNVDAATYFGQRWKDARLLPGTTDQYVLPFPGYTAEQIFAEVNARMRDRRVVWAEPNFMTEVVRHYTPNDPYFPYQWHLHNTGQTGGKADADVDAPEAWDIARGTNNVVVAIIDDGVQTSHPDLGANIFTNTAEIINGADDDGNGYADDLYGWDFYFGTNNPNPKNAEDTHGTPCAGVAAAVGNNGIGVAGATFSCKILPVKVFDGDTLVTATTLANAIRYAAGLTSPQRWRGADVLSISLSFAQSSVVDSALTDAATNGRNGKGCPIFCATGNAASGFWKIAVSVPAGTHTYKWVYKKDESVSVGYDTVWLDGVVFPNGTRESFEGGGLPSGWTTGGNAPWYNVQNGVGGNFALTGWDGPNSHALRAGAITHNQSTWVQVTSYCATNGTISFYWWVSCEGDPSYWYDYASFYVDGVEKYREDDDWNIVTSPDYPASHSSTIAVGASTDFDYRSDYSQYGSTLDFVAPSSGGLGEIYTVDRTGADGLATGDYCPDFGGTSAATPLAAGIAALVLSKNPTLTCSEVRTILRKSCDKIGGVTYTGGEAGCGGRNDFYGYGRLNAYRALTNTPALPSPPSAPTATAATGVTSTAFTANWTSVTGATGYRLDVSTNSAFSTYVSGYQDLDVGNVSSRSVSNLSAGTTYYYRVRAYNSTGTSTNSNTISVTTVPPAPIAHAASDVTSSSFTANWSSANGATGYRLDVSTDSEFRTYVGAYHDLDVGNVLSWNVSGLNPAATYYYRVRAYNASGTSANSPPVSVSTLSSQPFWLNGPSLCAEGMFCFTLVSPPGKVCEILISTNLIQWTRVAVFTNTPGMAIVITPVVNTPCCFYRARLLDSP